MKKLSVILAMMLAMTAFAGCQKKEEEKKADASKPEGIVEKWLDDQLAMDLGDYEDYFVEDADFNEDEFDEVKDPLSNVPADMEVFVEVFGEKNMEKMREAQLENSEYEIGEVEEDGDEAKITVTLKSPELEEPDQEELYDIMGIDPSWTDEDAYEWMVENGFDENPTEEDIYEAFSDEITEHIIDSAKDADKAEEEKVYTVVKNDDGEWRIKKIKDR